MRYTLRLWFPDDFRHEIPCADLEEVQAALAAIQKQKPNEFIYDQNNTEREGWAFTRSSLIAVEYFPEGSRSD